MSGFVFRVFCGVIFSALLVFTSATLAIGRDYTFNFPPDENKKIAPDEARIITRGWDKSGIVRVAVMSDHNFGYEFWSGVQLIDVKTEKIYNVSAVECYISFCLYVGKVPSGRYFINNLYAYSYHPTQVLASIGTKYAPIRNSMGSFEVKPSSVTDLGLIGIYQGVESGKGDGFLTSFLGNHPEIEKLYDELYGGYEKYLVMSDTVYGWDDSEWKDSALEKASIEGMFFADFSRHDEIDGKLFFPSAIGAIYALDWGKGYSRYDVDTLFMLISLSIDGERWVAGGEGGRIHVSKNRGVDWKPVDAFSSDEVVIKLFKKKDTLYALTASQKKKRVKLYAGTTDGLQFSQVSDLKFKLPGKSKGILAGLNYAQESLTKMYFNRKDLKGIKAHVSAGELIVQFNRKRFASYDFDKNKWRPFKPEKPIKAFFPGNDGVHMMSESYRISKKRARGKVRQEFDGLPFEGKAKLKLTSIYSYSEGLRKKLAEEEYFAVPRGGFYAREDGSKVAVLSLIENPAHLEKPPSPRLYSTGADSDPAVIHSLDNISFFFDSDLLPMKEDTLLIDRVAPRVYRFRADGSVDSYRLYERAYEQLSRIKKKVEI